MASGGSQDHWIRRLMECHVCLGKVKNHRALPCQHIFCQDCLVPLVHNGRLSCPTCGDDRKLDPGGVASLSRSVLLMQALERFCAQCMVKEKEILCTHCNRWLCTKCHDACRKIESLVEGTDRSMSRLSDTLDQIKMTRIEVEKNGIAVSSQVKRRSREFINALTAAVETREKAILYEIQTQTQKQLTKLDALSKDISDQMDELRSFSEKSDPANLESTDIRQLCDTWTKSVTDDVTTTTVSACYFSFTPGHQMPTDIVPALGQLSTSVKNIAGTSCQTTPDKQGVRPVKYVTGRLCHIVFGRQGPGPGELERPSYAAVYPVSGSIVVTDINNHRLNNSEQFVSMFGSHGSKKGQFDKPRQWPF